MDVIITSGGGFLIFSLIAGSHKKGLEKQLFVEGVDVV